MDSINGGSGPDDISGGPGDDQLLFGGAGPDQIAGGEGDDVLDAGTGPTPLDPNDDDILIGGSGVDRASYGIRATPVTVSWATARTTAAPGERDDVRGDIEELTGSHGNDELIGSPAADVIDGGEGADQHRRRRG